MDGDRVLAHLREVAHGIEADWLTEAAFTTPQLHDDFGSVIILPGWIQASEQVVMLLDASGIQQGDKGEMKYADVLAELDAPPLQAVSVYAFGATKPLQPEERLLPFMGGVLKVLPIGEDVLWSTNIGDRLQWPDLWDPDTPHPGHLGGSHIAFQTEAEQVARPTVRGEQFTPLEAACEIFHKEPESIWVRAPTHRPRKLSWRGRRVHSLIAVVEQSAHPNLESSAITFDLRGIGLWIMWVAKQGEVIFPGDVIEALDVEVLPGYSLVIKGGRKGYLQGMLYVQEREMLEASLRPTNQITPTQPEDETSSGPDSEEDDGQDGDESDPGNDPLPGSSDFSDQEPRRGPGPFGPPPPSPVNRPRSRTPPGRRRTGPVQATPAKLDIASCVGPVTFDLTEHRVSLPQDNELIAPDMTQFPLPDTTKQHGLIGPA